MLGAVRPEVRLEPDDAGRGQLAVSFPATRSDKDVSRLAQEVFALPGKIADARKRNLAIALDEFQAIAAFNGGSVEHALRAAVQHQRQVGYVFSGSEPALMERMLGTQPSFLQGRAGDAPAEDPRRSVRRVPRGAIPRNGDQGRAPASAPPSSISPAICPTTSSVSRTRCGTMCARRGARPAGLDDLHQTLRRLLGEHETLFEASGSGSRSRSARRCARRCSRTGASCSPPTCAARYRLSGASTVQASLAALVREDILTREGTHYVVVDSLLREWVARRTF